MNDTETEGRLPDFMFSRRRDIEIECNFELAGMLVTDIPNEKRLNNQDRRFIQRIIGELAHRVKARPELTDAAIWRTGRKPANGLSAPFDEHLVEERCRRCVCIMISAGAGSVVKVPSELQRQVMADVVGPDVKRKRH